MQLCTEAKQQGAIGWSCLNLKRRTFILQWVRRNMQLEKLRRRIYRDKHICSGLLCLAIKNSPDKGSSFLESRCTDLGHWLLAWFRP